MLNEKLLYIWLWKIQYILGLIVITDKLRELFEVVFLVLPMIFHHKKLTLSFVIIQKCKNMLRISLYQDFQKHGVYFQVGYWFQVLNLHPTGANTWQRNSAVFEFCSLQVRRDTLAGVPVIIYRPNSLEQKKAPAVVFFHGGGFVVGCVGK